MRCLISPLAPSTSHCFRFFSSLACRDSFASELESCLKTRNLAASREIHSRIADAGLGDDTLLGNLLIHVYGKCRSVDDAREVFDGIKEKRILSWNLMVAAYARNGYIDQARDIFAVAPEKNPSSWVTIIRGFAQNDDVERARKYLDAMPRRNLLAWNTMLGGYARQKYLDLTQETFDKIPEHDCYTWNTMIAAYVQAEGNNIHDAKRLFDAVPERGIISWDALTAAYAQHGYIKEAKEFFAKVPQRSVLSWTSLVAGYTRNGMLIQARLLFDEMPEWDDMALSNMVAAYTRVGHMDEALRLVAERGTSLENTRTWTALMTAYAHNGDLESASDVFYRMPQPDLVAETVMLSTYAQFGYVGEARKIFDEISARDKVPWITMIGVYGTHGNVLEARDMFNRMPRRDLVCWTAMISAYAQNAETSEALALFKLMDLEGIRPDKISFISVLNACQHRGFLREGEIIHSCIVNDCSLADDPTVGSVLLNMYGKHGKLAKARTIFEGLAGKTLMSWNAMVVAYAQNGHNQRAIELFYSMLVDGTRPNDVTFVIVLSACSHAGWVEEGRRIFVSIGDDYDETIVAPSHLWCVVDLLGRSGRVEDAEELVASMPFEPSEAARTASKLHSEDDFDPNILVEIE